MIAAIFTTAADLLERQGWTQGDFSEDEGRQRKRSELDVLGALAVANGQMPDYQLRGHALQAARVLAGRIDPQRRDFTDAHDTTLVDILGLDWNDAPHMTADQVIAELRAAALAVQAVAAA